MEYNNTQAAPGRAPAGAAAPQTAPAPRKVRRVGTVALGITLIFVGALLLAGLFLPALDVLRALQFSPLILIVLGIEVLVYAARPDVTLKYDLLSIFLCFVLLVGAAGSWTVARLIDGFGPAHSNAEHSLAQQLEEQAHQALAGVGSIARAEVGVTLNRPVSGSGADAVQLTPQDEVSANVYFAGDYADANAFAAQCRAVLDAAQAAGLPVDRYSFTNVRDEMPDHARSYYLWVDGLWQQDETAAALAGRVDTTYWYDDTGFASERDLEDYKAQFDADTSADTSAAATAETAAG